MDSHLVGAQVREEAAEVVDGDLTVTCPVYCNRSVSL